MLNNFHQSDKYAETEKLLLIEKNAQYPK